MSSIEQALTIVKPNVEIREANREVVATTVDKLLQQADKPGQYVEGALLDLDGTGLQPTTLILDVPDEGHFFLNPTESESADEEEFVRPNYAYYLQIIKPNREPVAVMCLSFEDFSQDNKIVVQEYISVDEPFMRMGLGRSLLRTEEKVIKKLIRQYEPLTSGREIIHLYQDFQTDAGDGVPLENGWGDSILREKGYWFQPDEFSAHIPEEVEYDPDISRVKIFQNATKPEAVG